MKQSNPKPTELREKVTNFINNWHRKFLLDLWWRRKYNVPFGSSAHKEMNFIDMLTEYQEEFIIKKAKDDYNKKDEMEFKEEDERIVHVSKEEIDEDYKNINLEDFNNG